MFLILILKKQKFGLWIRFLLVVFISQFCDSVMSHRALHHRYASFVSMQLIFIADSYMWDCFLQKQKASDVSRFESIYFWTFVDESVEVTKKKKVNFLGKDFCSRSAEFIVRSVFVSHWINSGLNFLYILSDKIASVF